MPDSDSEKWVSLGDAETQLGVTRATLHYYMEALKIERKKFQFDRKVYMRAADFERIRKLKSDAEQRGSQIRDEDKPLDEVA